MTLAHRHRPPLFALIGFVVSLAVFIVLLAKQEGEREKQAECDEACAPHPGALRGKCFCETGLERPS